MSKYYNIGDTVGYWTLTLISKKSPTSIGGGMMSLINWMQLKSVSYMNVFYMILFQHIINQNQMSLY